MTWNHVKKLNTSRSIMRVENLVDYTFEEGFVDCVICNNGARPNLKYFDTEYTKERVFRRLLSFNETDENNIYDTLEILRWDGIEVLVPFGITEFGNYICFNKGDNSIVLYDHENGNVEWIAHTFREFLEGLY